MVAILMMSANLSTLGLLKIKLFSNESYCVIIFDHGITNKILICDSNGIVDVLIWPLTQLIMIWTEKTILCEVLLVQVQ